MTVSYERQSGILDPHTASRTHVTICGAGTVGSNVATCLARAGLGSFELWDMDTVESHNIPSQDFTVADIGAYKVSATAQRMLAVQPDAQIREEAELSGFEVFDEGFLILAVDNMELRKTLFEQACHNPMIHTVMDFRMGGWILQAWTVDMSSKDQKEKYAKTLYSSDEVTEAVCGTRTFAPIGPLSGAVATCLITQKLSTDDEVSPPFYTYMDMSAMQMITAGRN
jgi:hypothetical protein